MDFPEKYHYSKEHEWISSLSGTVKIGVTAYAIEQLGDIVHVDLPDAGTSFEQGDSFGTIESTKTVSDLYMPAAGKVVEVNQTLSETPEKLQEDAYNDGWLVKVEIKEINNEDLMDAAKYTQFIQED